MVWKVKGKPDPPAVQGMMDIFRECGKVAKTLFS